MMKCQKDPTCGRFLKRGFFRDIKNFIHMCRTHKYKNTNTKYTNTQIQHMTKCQKDPRCGIFLKRGFFEDIKNYIPTGQTPKIKKKNKFTNTQIHKYKYTNTASAKVAYMPKVCYIFENVMVRGPQKMSCPHPTGGGIVCQ